MLFRSMISLTLPCPDRRNGPPLALAVDVHVSGSLEGAGHSVANLTRLVEEYGIATLPTPTRQYIPVAGVSRPGETDISAHGGPAFSG